MGAQQSTRTLTIENDNPANVIKVSDSVINRLRGNADEAKKLSKQTQEQPAVSGASPIPAFGPPASYSPFYQLSHNSLQVRQEKEALLRNNDAYWQERINKLEDVHEQMNKFMENEYNDAMNEVKGSFGTTPPVGNKNAAACQEGKKAVLECYKKFPNEPMRCAPEVQAFSDCVDKQRLALVAKVANRG